MSSVLDRKYRYFLECARSQSLVQAAKRLGLTQPTLSEAIRDLESELQTPLFERTSTGMSLTHRGRLLAEGVERGLVGLSAEIKAAIASKEQPVVKMGCVVHLCDRVIFPLFQKRPKVFERFQVSATFSVDSYRAVLAGKIDFAFVSWTSAPKGLPYEKVSSDFYALVGLAKRFPVLKTARSLKDLAQLPRFVLPKPQEDWTEALDKNQSGFTVRDSQTLRSLVLSGMAIGECQVNVFTKSELKGMTISSLPTLYRPTHLYLIYRQDISIETAARMREILGLVTEQLRKNWYGFDG